METIPLALTKASPKEENAYGIFFIKD